jgi:ankyrin repeat protein
MKRTEPDTKDEQKPLLSPTARNGLDKKLIGACIEGKVTTIEECLRKGANVDAKTGRTALSKACKEGCNMAVVTALLGAGADANFRDKKGKTPLMLAVKSRHLALVQALLLRPEKPGLHVVDKKGRPPLLVAIRNGNHDIVKTLLAAGADKDKGDELDGLCPLSYAILVERTDAFDLLLKMGADPENSDSAGCTPLMHACEEENRHAVEALLGRGARVDGTDSDGRSAIAHAHDNKEIIDLLKAADKKTTPCPSVEAGNPHKDGGAP